MSIPFYLKIQHGARGKSGLRDNMSYGRVQSKYHKPLGDLSLSVILTCVQERIKSPISFPSQVNPPQVVSSRGTQFFRWPSVLGGYRCENITY